MDAEPGALGDVADAQSCDCRHPGLLHPGNLYGASKWAVTVLARNTRLMVTGDGIGVTPVAPGSVVSEFWDGVGGPPEGL
ncbi:hypothetical protein STSO111631_11795 [Stackebrandtia soli]